MNNSSEPLLILCGGLSQRMGQAKALLPYQGSTLIAHHIARAVSDRLVWLAAADQRYDHTESAEYLNDYFCERQGPLGAILPALIKAQNLGFQGIYILSCDTLIDVKDYIDLLQTAQQHAKWQDGIIMLADNERHYPLLAHWATSVYTDLKQALNQQQRRVMAFVQSQKTMNIAMPQYWCHIANFNTLNEYQNALNYIESAHNLGHK